MARFKETDYQKIIGYWATKILGPVDITDLYAAYEKEYGKFDWDILSTENGEKTHILIKGDVDCNKMMDNLDKLMPKFLWRDVRYNDRPNSPKEDN